MMKNKFSIVWAVLFLLLISNIYGYITVVKINQGNLIEKQKIYEKYVGESIKYDKLVQNKITELKFNNNVDVECIKISSTTGKTIHLSDLVLGKPKLFFWFTDLHCQVCVETQLEQLKSFASLIGKDNIIILASLKSEKAAYLYKRTKKILLPTYFIDKKMSNVFLKANTSPFYFAIDKKHRINSIIIADVYDDRLMTDYFKHIKESYFH